MTLRELTTAYGHQRIAEVMGRTGRSLVDLRRGRTPLTVDDLFRLRLAFPHFDVISTIEEIGALRVSKGWDRPSPEIEATLTEGPGSPCEICHGDPDGCVVCDPTWKTVRVP